MQSIKDLSQQIDITQAKVDTENQLAQQERDKAEQARASDNPAQMQSHLQASQQHDQRVLGFQNEINNLHIKAQQQQTQAAELTQRRDLLTQTKQQELDRLNAEIQQITGEPQ